MLFERQDSRSALCIDLSNKNIAVTLCITQPLKLYTISQNVSFYRQFLGQQPYAWLAILNTLHCSHTAKAQCRFTTASEDVDSD